MVEVFGWVLSKTADQKIKNAMAEYFRHHHGRSNWIRKLIGRPCACANVTVSRITTAVGRSPKAPAFNRHRFTAAVCGGEEGRGPFYLADVFVFLDQSLIFILRIPLDYSGQTVG